MINYIKKLTEDLVRAAQPNSTQASRDLNVFNLPTIIAEEINKLDPRDFLPSARHEFVIVRQRFRTLAQKSSYTDNEGPEYIQPASRLKHLLDSYGGENSHIISRNFNFISDAELKDIIERDYKELSGVLMPDGAWKSAVILSGSILEAILLDILANDANYSSSLASPKTPKNRGGRVKDLKEGEWRLQNLIEVAVDIGILPENRAASIDQVLRDFRNFVHPKKEIRSQHPCTEAEALMAKGGLDGVCNYLEQNAS